MSQLLIVRFAMFDFLIAYERQKNLFMFLKSVENNQGKNTLLKLIDIQQSLLILINKLDPRNQFYQRYLDLFFKNYASQQQWLTVILDNSFPTLEGKEQIHHAFLPDLVILFDFTMAYDRQNNLSWFLKGHSVKNNSKSAQLAELIETQEFLLENLSLKTNDFSQTLDIFVSTYVLQQQLLASIIMDIPSHTLPGKEFIQQTLLPDLNNPNAQQSQPDARQRPLYSGYYSPANFFQLPASNNDNPLYSPKASLPIFNN